MEKLREFRKEKRLSQEAMAKILGITLSMYEKVECGRAGASAAFMRRFKKAFPDQSVDDIFFEIKQQKNCCRGGGGKER